MNKEITGQKQLHSSVGVENQNRLTKCTETKNTIQ